MRELGSELVVTARLRKEGGMMDNFENFEFLRLVFWDG